MNKYDLFDAMNGIDDDLLLRSDRKAVRKFPIRKALIAAAAVMALAVTAMASPAVREWFFHPGIEEENEANAFYTLVAGFAEDGTPIQHESFGWQESVGRVDLNVEGVVSAPQTIRQLRVPTYFQSQDWDYTPFVQFPDEEFRWYLGTWQRWISENGEEKGQYLIFQQDVINLEYADLPAGHGQFFIDLGNNAPVEEKTLTIDSIEYQIYIVGESNLDGMVGFPAHTDVVWFDGEYAYYMETGGMDLEMITDILRSVAPAQNPAEYIRPARYDSIDTYYILSDVPENLPQTGCELRDYRFWNCWGDFENGISLEQVRDQKDGNDVYSVDIPVTLSDLRIQYPDAVFETMDVDGMTVSIVRHGNDTEAYWQQDGCCFTLSLYGDPLASTEEISNLIRSVLPVETPIDPFSP